LNKIVSIKNINAIILTTVLVAGIIALSNPSFMTTANALSGPLFTEDNSYNSYEPREYPTEYADKKYNSYESTDYGMDHDKKSYGNDNYESKYPSYKPDYKPEYPSYGKDNNDKSKDSSSVLLKKLKCNNVNVNLNGIEANIGGAVDSEGAAAASTQGSEQASASLAGNGERNNNWVKKFVDKDFGVICISNNNNNNILAGNDECPEADEIESCFRQFLLDALFPNFVDELESEEGITVEINGQEVTLRSFEDICEALEDITTFAQLRLTVGDILQEALGFVPMDNEFFSCIAEALGIPILH
jgi:hypothetical protein